MALIDSLGDHDAQAESMLTMKLATHLACGHLTGIAKEEKDLAHLLQKECYEVRGFTTPADALQDLSLKH